MASLQAAVAANKAESDLLRWRWRSNCSQRVSSGLNVRPFLAELSRGSFLADGQGHAARLQLVAASIPAQVWVTDVKADELQLDISGFTLEPLR